MLFKPCSVSPLMTRDTFLDSDSDYEGFLINHQNIYYYDLSFSLFLTVLYAGKKLKDSTTN